MQYSRIYRSLGLSVGFGSLALLLGLMVGASATVQYAYDADGNVVSRTAGSGGPPQIIGQPSSQVVDPGAGASLSAVVANASGVTFQWRFKETNVPGARGDSLVLTNVSAADEGQYSVVVTNSFGSVTSASAALTIDSDGDSLADSWELAGFGSLSQAATGDFDGDGVSNIDEFLQGTDPNNNASLRVRLSVATMGSGTVEFSPLRENYAIGETVTLTAVPLAPYSFAGWSGALTGAVNPGTLVLNGHTSATANFVYVPPPPGLLAWLRGEADASDLIAGHHGAFYAGDTVAAPSVTPSGLAGGAFNFDGSNYIRVPDASELQPPRYTVEAWVFPAVQSAAPQTIIARGSATADLKAWSLSLVDGRARFASQDLGNPPEFIQSFSTIPLNQWTHLAVAYDGDVRILYVNGAEEQRAVRRGPPVYDPAPVPMTIGSEWRANTSADRFTGLIDEVSLYGRALTPAEIGAVLGAGRGGKCVTQPYFTTPAQLRDGVAGESYSGSIGTAIASSPVSFTVSADSLPPGLALSESGVLSGVPAHAGDYRFTVAVRDGANRFNQQLYSLRVAERIVPPLGMLAWWRGEGDGSGLERDWIAGHDGTFYRGSTAADPAYIPEGKVGSGFDFDGSLHVRVPDSLALHPPEVTVEGWVYPTWYTSTPYGIAGHGSDWNLYLYDGRVTFATNHGFPLQGIGIYSPNPLPLYEWTHVAGTFENGQKVLYINGAPVASESGRPPLLYDQGGNPVTIGSLVGRVDEVSVYDRALTEPEVLAIANAGVAGKSLSGPFTMDLGTVAAGQPFSYDFSSLSGRPQTAVFVISGALPPGFALTSGGVLSGAGAAGGSFTFTVRAKDAGGLIQTRICSLRVVLSASRPPGLISWWRAENNAQDAIGGNHGVAAGPSGYRAGKVGSAFSLNGFSDSIQIPDAPSLRPESVTLEAWVMMTSLPDIQVIFTKPVGGAISNSWGLYYWNRGLHGGIGNAGTFADLGAPWNPELGRWYHVAFAFDAASRQQSLYLDGVRAASGPVSIEMAYDTQPVLLGRDTEHGEARWFVSGAVDEPAIYSRALEDAEIAAIFDAGPAGKALPGSGGGGDLDDPDGDGLVNLVEYGLSTDPGAFSTPPGVTARSGPDGSMLMVISLLRDPAKTDITLTVEDSSDLLNWTPVALSAGGGPFAGTAGIEGEVPGAAARKVTIIEPVAPAPAGQGSRRFLRVKVSR
ncbi:MAG: hypothetical protein JWM59_4565 [Verrucomicrobiales bacterium]|nr:hypothetical protein [Verrucomicrobiales bacterium]